MRHIQVGKGAIATLSYTPDGKTLVCVEACGKIHVHRAVHWIDLSTGECRRTLDLCEDRWLRQIPYAEECEQTGEAFVSPDGEWVAVQRYLGDPVFLDLWDTRSEEWREVELGELDFVAGGVCFSAGSDLMIVASGTDGGGTKSLERIDLRAVQRLSAIDFPGYSVRRMQLTADERLLAALTHGSLFALPHTRGRSSSANMVELEQEVSDSAEIRFSPGGNELAVVDGPQVLFWDCKSPDTVTMNFEGEGVIDLAYSRDDRYLVLGCDDGTVRLHDRATNGEAGRYDWKIGSVKSVAFAADCMTAAVGGESGQVVVWDVDA
jgi:WD40 repeat protein